MNNFFVKKYSFWISAIYIIGFFSIFRNGISYTDDNIRIITGDSLFLSVGRPLTELTMLALHSGHPLFDASPFLQILALTILTGVSVIFACKCKDLPIWAAVVASAAIGMNPMIAENISYKFDAITMVMALALAIAPFLLKVPKKLYFPAVAICTLSSLMFYQAAVGATMAMLAGQLIHSILRKISPSQYLTRAGMALGGMLTGAIAYKLIISIFLNKYLTEGSWGGDHAQTVNANNFFKVLLSNTEAYYRFISENIISTPLGISFLSIIIISFSTILFKFFLSDRKYKLGEICVLFIGLLCLAISPLGLQIVLVNPVFQPRSLYSMGVTFAVLQALTFTEIKSRKILAILAVPSFLFLIQSVLVTSLLGNMQQQQARWEAIVITGLAHDLSEFTLDGTKKNVRLSGSLGYAPEVQVGLRKYPLLSYMARYSVGDIWSFPALLSSTGISVNLVKEVGSEKTLIKRRFGYNVYTENNGNLLIQFKLGGF